MWKKYFNFFQKKPINKTTDLAAHVMNGIIPKHVAIIMDGNGRWAKQQGFPRTYGHRAGAEVLRNIVKIASDIGIQVLTVYAFSTENWKRPHEEVSFLMSLISEYISNQIKELHEKNVCIRFIGDKSELNLVLQQKISQAERLTENNNKMILNVAINYGGRNELIVATKKIAQKLCDNEIKLEDIDENLISANLYTAGLPDPDILIRTTREYRISNFLLWQLAYTEFLFTDVSWPEFTPQHFYQAIIDFQQRDRRYGGLK